MRDIKFRGYGIFEWVYGFLVKDNDKFYIVGEVETSNDYGEGTDLYAIEWYEVTPKSVGQCTGIKDCNGVEIYEGDILNVSKEYSGSFFPTQVIFENGAFRTQISHMHNPVPLTEERALTLEIIGNIHQNKELLTA